MRSLRNKGCGKGANLGGHVHRQTQTTYGTPTFVGYYSKGKPIKVAPRPRRNDPCPCGSGQKYKNCCLTGGNDK